MAKKATMNIDKRRITLISRNPGLAARDWNQSSFGQSRLIFVDAFKVLRYALDGIHEHAQDVERVIIDRTGSAMQYLELLSALPQDFTGDALLIRGDGDGFLSSLGRGGDRLVYSLRASDVDFYLQTNGLITNQAFAQFQATPPQQRHAA